MPKLLTLSVSALNEWISLEVFGEFIFVRLASLPDCKESTETWNKYSKCSPWSVENNLGQLKRGLFPHPFPTGSQTQHSSRSEYTAKVKDSRWNSVEGKMGESALAFPHSTSVSSALLALVILHKKCSFTLKRRDLLKGISLKMTVKRKSWIPNWKLFKRDSKIAILRGNLIHQPV